MTLIGFITFGQEKVLYHSYSPTASSWDIIEWNVSDTTKHKWLLKETLDKRGRVIELEFLKDGKLIENPLCYLANRVKFEYLDNKIIEKLYHSDRELMATDCEMHYQTTYFLDDEGFIIKMESIAKYDFEGIEQSEIEQWKKWVPEKTIMKDSIGVNLEVDYYYQSFAKMNGVYPVNRNYEFIEDYYFGDQPEKKSIKKGLEKTKN